MTASRAAAPLAPPPATPQPRASWQPSRPRIRPAGPAPFPTPRGHEGAPGSPAAMLQNWMGETAVPSVLCLGSEGVQHACMKNGLAFHELLGAFGSTEGGSVPFRSANNNTYQLTRFRVRFVCPEDLAAPTDMAEMRERLAEAIRPRESDGDFIEDAMHAPLSSAASLRKPWYLRFRRALADSLVCQEHEMFDYPSMMLVAVSTTDDDVIATMRRLSSAQHLPQPFHNGHFDPNLFKVFVLVHDAQATPAEDAAEKLRQLRELPAFSTARMVTVNSLPASAPNADQADIWSPHLRRVPGSLSLASLGALKEGSPPLCATLGCCLSSEDMVSLRSFGVSLLQKGVIPCMERRIQNLNAVVAKARRGVRNTLRSFFRGGREEEKDAAAALGSIAQSAGVHSVRYPYHRIEAQMRLLADSAFMVRDFDLALSTYKLARDDYRQDKALGALAACHEMLLLCAIATSAPKAAADAYTSAALEAHARSAEAARAASGAVGPAQRLHSRFALWTLDALERAGPGAATRASCRAGAEAAIRASARDEPLVGGVLMECAAALFLRGGMARKRCLHMALAGNLFHNCAQNAHAVRCYAAVAASPGAGGWGLVQDHVHLTLARHLVGLQRPEVALAFYLRLVREGRQPPERQQSFLRDLLYICRTTPRDTLASLPRGATDEQLLRAHLSPSPRAAEDAAAPSAPSAPLEVDNLGLPRVLRPSAAILETLDPRERELRPPRLAAQDEAAWRAQQDACEAEILAAAAVARGLCGWEDRRAACPAPPPRGAPRRGRGRALPVPARAAAALEPIAFALVLRNPLDVRVEVSDLQLVAELDEDGAPAPSGSYTGPGALDALPRAGRGRRGRSGPGLGWRGAMGWGRAQMAGEGTGAAARRR